jgi:predicted dehydrogenase
LDEMRHFLACLRRREAPCCNLNDGVRALEIALAAGRSAREGRAIDV